MFQIRNINISLIDTGHQFLNLANQKILIGKENLIKFLLLFIIITGCVLPLKAQIPVIGVSLGLLEKRMSPNETFQMTATISPDNATNKNVTWSSTNSDVVTVSATGLVTARAVGTAQIWVRTVDGEKSDWCTFIVETGRISVTGVSFSKKTLTMLIGDTESLVATVSPANATNKGIVWSNTNNSVASIVNYEKITADGVGTTKIIVETQDGRFRDTCDVTVIFNGTIGDGVVINGICWASSNVDAPGTFAANPEDAGRLFQWNRRKGWPTSGTVSGWNSSDITGDVWESTNDPCPQGWRVPTQAEFESLVSSGSGETRETTRNGVKGYLFGTDDRIFLPDVDACRMTDGNIWEFFDFAGYWTSSFHASTTAIRFDLSDLSFYGIDRTMGLSVRCVKDAGDPQIVSKIIPAQMDEAGNLKIQARVQSTYHIVEMKYRVDEGNEVVIPVNDSKTDLVFTTTYSNPNLNAGTHSFSFQFKNAVGWWSPVEISRFVKISNVLSDMNLNVTIEDKLVRLVWNSAADANAYKLTRDGYVIQSFKSSEHPITLNYTDNPPAGNHTYRIVAYNMDEYVQNSSPEKSISVSGDNVSTDSYSDGTVLGRIVDENGVEMDGVKLEVRYLKDYNTTETIKTVLIYSEKGRYKYQGIPFEQYIRVVPSKEGYDFSASLPFRTTNDRPVETLNFTAKQTGTTSTMPQTPDLQLRTQMTSFNNIDALQMNIFTFDVQNISYAVFNGSINMYLESTDGKTVQCISTRPIQFDVNETKPVTITVPARTITLPPGNYNLVLRSAKNTNTQLDGLKLVYDTSPSYITTTNNARNPLPVTVSGEMPKDLSYWKNRIIDVMNGVENGIDKGNSYLKTYTKYEKIFAPNADHITGTEVNLILLSAILKDVGNAKTLMEMEKKATSYIDYMIMLNNVISNANTEEAAFKLFCKVVGSFSSNVPLLGEYLDVLVQARSIIKSYGDYLFTNTTMIGEINQGTVCLGIKVKRNVGDSYHDALAISNAIRNISLQALDVNGKLHGREATYEKCTSNCCGTDKTKLYLKQKDAIFRDVGDAVAFQNGGGSLIIKIEWTNGRISYVPVNREFCIINSIGYRTIDIEFESKNDSNWYEQITGVSYSSDHMANKIYLKYYGQ